MNNHSPGEYKENFQIELKEKKKEGGGSLAIYTVPSGSGVCHTETVGIV